MNDYVFNVPNNVKSRTFFFDDPHLTNQKMVTHYAKIWFKLKVNCNV